MLNAPGDTPQVTTAASPRPPPADIERPGTRAELQAWIHDRLNLPRHAEAELNAVIDHVMTRQERLWQASKDEAIKALLAGFAERMAALRHEIVERDTTVSNISHYFERLVSELTDKTRRDPKTKLMNLGRFMEQLESFLALEQRTRWCAVGLVDITAFKWYNDALGHAVGDRIIERVATILGEQIRSDDLIAQETGRRPLARPARAARRRRVLLPHPGPRRLRRRVAHRRAVPRRGRTPRLAVGGSAPRGAAGQGGRRRRVPSHGPGQRSGVPSPASSRANC